MSWRIVRRTIFVLCGLIAGAFLASVIARQMQIVEGQAALTRYAQRITKSSEQITQDIDDAVAAVKADGLSFCSDEEITMMREIVFHSAHVRDLGRMRDGMLFCSTGAGRFPAPRNDTRPNMAMGPNSFYINGPILFSNHAYGFVADMAGVSTVLNTNIFAALDEPPYFFSGSLYDRQGHRAMPAFGHPTTLTAGEVISGETVERDGIFYLPVCPEHGIFCVIASESRAAMLDGNNSLIVGYQAGGALLGGAAAVIVLLVYRRERSFERQLRRAIRRGQLTLVYQPVVDLDSGQVVAAEALVRWVDDRGEAIRTDALVSVAEEQGFVGEITALVLRKAIDELRDLLSEGSFRVTLNIAAADLMDERFPLDLERRRLAAGVPSRSIGLEVTERSAVDQDAAIASLARLKQAGHTIYIDDFGTGYSSLSYLHRLDAGALKIDRVFTQTVGTDAVTASVVPQILDMASKLELLVVVEGIETRAQAEYFRATGQGILGQGWYLSHPVSAAQLLKLMRDGGRIDFPD